MKVDIEKPHQLISHLLLNNADVVNAVSDSKEWKENHIINCEVLFNGIKLDGSVLEDTLKYFVEYIEKECRERYDADRLDAVIEERAKQLLKEHADNALEKIYDLTNKLQEADNLLVPYWGRNKD